MKAFWIVSFSIMVLFSCYGQKVEVCQKLTSSRDKEIYSIDAYSAFKEMDEALPLSKVVEDVEFIPLETTEECLLDDYLKNITITTTDIIVYDYNRAYRFDRKGKFINAIGKRGQGPGEYVKCMETAVDTLKRIVYFLDQNARILKYSYEGNYLGSLPTKLASTKILKGGKDIFVMEDRSYLFRKPKDRYSTYFYSESLERLVSKMKCEKKEKIPALALCDPITYNYRGDIYVQDFWSDTIYKAVTPTLLSPHAVIKKGKFEERTRPDKSLRTGKEDPADKMVLGIYRSGETDRFIFLGTNKGLIAYDKKHKQTFMGGYINRASLKDDLYGAPGARSDHFPECSNGNEIYAFRHPYEFIENKGVEHLVTGKKHDDYVKMVENLDPEGNPVIMILKIKK